MTDYKSMFEQAVRTLAAIDEALGIGDDGCSDPDQTLTAIAELKAAKVGAGKTVVTREMIGAAHDIMLARGDFVLSAALLERIYLAMERAAPPPQTPFDTCPTCEALSRKPLTDEQVAVACGWAADRGCKPLPQELRIARAIEAAHGIGIKKGDSNGLPT